jgi:hypothetical protein
VDVATADRHHGTMPAASHVDGLTRSSYEAVVVGNGSVEPYQRVDLLRHDLVAERDSEGRMGIHPVGSCRRGCRVMGAKPVAVVPI